MRGFETICDQGVTKTAESGIPRCQLERAPSRRTSWNKGLNTFGEMAERLKATVC